MICLTNEQPCSILCINFSDVHNYVDEFDKELLSKDKHENLSHLFDTDQDDF